MPRPQRFREINLHVGIGWNDWFHEIFSNFTKYFFTPHSVEITEIYPHFKPISWNQFIVWFFSEKNTLTEFLLKSRGGKFLKLPHCGPFTRCWLFRNPGFDENIMRTAYIANITLKSCKWHPKFKVKSVSASVLCSFGWAWMYQIPTQVC